MSDAAIIAIVSVIATVVVALAGHAKDYFVRRQDIAAKERERREDAQEWYRRTLFEQRLSTANQAYSYLLRINRLRAFAKGDEERQHELRDCVIEAREWFDANILYLYESPPSSSDYIGSLNSATDLTSPDFHSNMDGALKYLRVRSERLMEFERELP